MPCTLAEWCEETDTFDCPGPMRQQHRTVLPIDYPGIRNLTGKLDDLNPPPGQCIAIELDLSAVTPFRYESELGNATDYFRMTPNLPYGWGPTNTTNPWSSPSATSPDRQIALVRWVNMNQGVYVCANGGNCTDVDTCTCAPGWIGFDCRTPVCRQGYYEDELLNLRFPGAQGQYRCSERAMTVWENSAVGSEKFAGYVHEHPNYYSRHMDDAIGWVPVHQKTPPLGDDTDEGWRRGGWWERVPRTRWLHGLCDVEYNRTCDSGGYYKAVDLRSKEVGDPVDDTEYAFRPRVNVTYEQEVGEGRWFEAGG